jgi:hypothetical protein
MQSPCKIPPGLNSDSRWPARPCEAAARGRSCQPVPARRRPGPGSRAPDPPKGRCQHGESPIGIHESRRRSGAQRMRRRRCSIAQTQYRISAILRLCEKARLRDLDGAAEHQRGCADAVAMPCSALPVPYAIRDRCTEQVLRRRCVVNQSFPDSDRGHDGGRERKELAGEHLAPVRL